MLFLQKKKQKRPYLAQFKTRGKVFSTGHNQWSGGSVDAQDLIGKCDGEREFAYLRDFARNQVYLVKL